MRIKPNTNANVITEVVMIIQVRRLTKAGVRNRFGTKKRMTTILIAPAITA